MPEFVGFDGLDFGSSVSTGGRDVGKVLHLQHYVFFEGFLNLCVQVEDRELQQAYSLLQLRRHGQRLTEF